MRGVRVQISVQPSHTAHNPEPPPTPRDHNPIPPTTPSPTYRAPIYTAHEHDICACRPAAMSFTVDLTRSPAPAARSKRASRPGPQRQTVQEACLRAARSRSRELRERQGRALRPRRRQLRLRRDTRGPGSPRNRRPRGPLGSLGPPAWFPGPKSQSPKNCFGALDCQKMSWRSELSKNALAL